MNKVFGKLMIVAVLAIMLPVEAKANIFRPTYTHGAKVSCGITPTGGGKVYVATEATNFQTVRTSDWSEEGAEGGNSSNTRGASMPVFIYAQENSGYEFLGWSETEDGPLFTASDYEESRNDGRSIKKNYTVHNEYGNGTVEYVIWARFKPILYDYNISVSGLQNGESAIFNVSRGGTILYTVVLDSANPSAVLKNLDHGTYTVTPSPWSWSYTMSPTSDTKTISSASVSSSFAATRVAGAKKHDEKSRVNWGAGE